MLNSPNIQQAQELLCNWNHKSFFSVRKNVFVFNFKLREGQKKPRNRTKIKVATGISNRVNVSCCVQVLQSIYIQRHLNETNTWSLTRSCWKDPLSLISCPSEELGNTCNRKGWYGLPVLWFSPAWRTTNIRITKATVAQHLLGSLLLMWLNWGS